MAAPRFGVLGAWVTDLLRRPRTITPFKLEDGAQLEGDPATAEGAVITGGRVRLVPDYVYEVRGDTVVFRRPRQPTGGSFKCYCTSAGACVPNILPTEVKCVHKEGNACLGECRIKVVLKPHVTLASDVFASTTPTADHG
jgi:hypothetical protein